MEAHTLSGSVRVPELDATTTTQSPGAPLKVARRVALRDALDRRLLAVSDIVAAALSLWLCISVIGDDRLRRATLLGVLIVVPISKIIGLYERDQVLVHRTTIEELPAIVELSTLYTFVIWLLSPEVMVGSLGRGQALILWLTLASSALVGRAIVRTVIRHCSPPERCLLIGDTRAAEQLVRTIERTELTAQIVGRMDTHAWGEVPSNEALSATLESNKIDRMIIVPDEAHPEATLDLVRAAQSLGVRVSILPRVLEVVGSNVEFDNIGGVPLLGVHPLKLSRSSRMVKRAFDLVLATLGVVAAAPLLLILAVAVKLDSRGPVFFRQTRVGRNGKCFQMVKFRTMVLGADEMKLDLAELNEADGLFKIADDPRVTSVGRFLRRASLDELPQIFNVLKGDMSMVGPRPLVTTEDELITGYDRDRLSLTPGMTGPWQILGSSRIPLSEMVKIDYLYVASWTLWADVKILLRTLPYMLARRGM